jgi:hypothetical protein
MAKKVYAVRVGRKPGIYHTWDEAKAQVDGFKGPVFKGFTSMAEAEAFMKGGSVSSGAAKSATVKNDIVTAADAFQNLQKVTVEDGGKYNILDSQIEEQCIDKVALITKAFKTAFASPVSIDDISANEDVKTLMARYGCDFDSLTSECNIAFVDGGGDKVGANFESTRILFGVVFYNAEESKLSLYKYALERGTDFDWLFRASNVAGEELAALFAMYIAARMGLKQIHIYQDNNLPAKYFSGAFKKIHKMDDYMLQIFINASLQYLKQGMEINFLYVPSEHAAYKDKAKATKGKAVYESQDITKVSFEMAEFLNGVSDRLADYKK